MKYSKIGVLIIAILVSGVWAQTKNDVKWKTISKNNYEFDFRIPSRGYKDLSFKKLGQKIGFFSSNENSNLYYVRAAPDTVTAGMEILLRFAAAFEPDCSTGEVESFKTYGCNFTEDDIFDHSFLIVPTPAQVYVLYIVTNKNDPGVRDDFLRIGKRLRENKNEASSNAQSTELVWQNFREGKLKSDLIAEEKVKTGSYVNPTGGPKERPLQLLSRKRPEYTPIAVFFDIEGTVKLRVIFGRDGSIGDIEKVVSLPFGLGRMAVEAAQEFTFLPAIRDGNVVSLNKSVTYHFTKY